MNKESSSFLTTPTAILIGAVLISVSILFSGGIIKIKGFKQATSGNQPTDTLGVKQEATPAPDQPEDTGPVKVALDDDPVLGDKNAPVTIVEFSDYECPFCKRHFDQTHQQIVKEYIDTGKAKLVFRDLPLDFHQNARKEAEAANCAREQGGDTAYFKFHDEIFTKTTSNGTGLSLDKLPELAKNVGLSGTLLQQCLDSGKFKEEVDKDLADASKAGANGTPTFIIGKSTTNGTIEGTKIIGAQPYDVFKKDIDNLLNGS